MLVISQFETQLNTIENPEISPTQKQNRIRLQEFSSRTEIGGRNLRLIENRSTEKFDASESLVLICFEY
jgi:hypothetical protein